MDLSRALWQDDPERPGCTEAAAATGAGGGGECVPPPPRSQVGEGFGSHSFLTLPLLQSSQESQEPDQQKLLTSVIIGLVVSLVLVLVILITALVCLRKRYDLYFSPSLQLSLDPDVQCVCVWVGRKSLVGVKPHPLTGRMVFALDSSMDLG